MIWYIPEIMRSTRCETAALRSVIVENRPSLAPREQSIEVDLRSLLVDNEEDKSNDITNLLNMEEPVITPLQRSITPFVSPVTHEPQTSIFQPFMFQTEDNEEALEQSSPASPFQSFMDEMNAEAEAEAEANIAREFQQPTKTEEVVTQIVAEQAIPSPQSAPTVQSPQIPSKPTGQSGPIYIGTNLEMRKVPAATAAQVPVQVPTQEQAAEQKAVESIPNRGLTSAELASSALQIAVALNSESAPMSEQLIENSAEQFIERMAASNEEVHFNNEDIIDKFLTQTNLRIRVNETEAEAEDIAKGPKFTAEEDFVSEDLAQIYTAQGLNSMAIDIYRKLSLLNSEKSAYFAELIDELMRKK